ncbi:unnamed protein product [Dicrocoelium dendriticum]|nr:unnamed protein product [Dicrocoelium dendriticum]
MEVKPGKSATIGLIHTSHRSDSNFFSTTRSRTDVGRLKKCPTARNRENRLTFLFTPSHRRSKSADPSSDFNSTCSFESSFLRPPLVGINGSFSKDKLKASPVDITGSTYDNYRRLRDSRRWFTSQPARQSFSRWPEYPKVTASPVNGKQLFDRFKCNNPPSRIRINQHPRPSSFHPYSTLEVPVIHHNPRFYQEGLPRLDKGTPQSESDDSTTASTARESLYDCPPSIAPYPCPTLQLECSLAPCRVSPATPKTSPSFSNRIVDPFSLFRRRKHPTPSTEPFTPVSDLVNRVHCVNSLRMWRGALIVGPSASKLRDKRLPITATSTANSVPSSLPLSIQSEIAPTLRSSTAVSNSVSPSVVTFNFSKKPFRTNGPSKDICKVTACHSSPKLYPNVVHHALKGRAKSGPRTCCNQTVVHFDPTATVKVSSSPAHLHQPAAPTPANKNVWEPKSSLTSQGNGISHSITVASTSAPLPFSGSTASLRSRFKLQKSTKKNPLDRSVVANVSSVPTGRLRLCSQGIGTPLSSEVVSFRNERCSSVYSATPFCSETISGHCYTGDVPTNNPNSTSSIRNSWSASCESRTFAHRGNVPISICRNSRRATDDDPRNPVSSSTVTGTPFATCVLSTPPTTTHPTVCVSSIPSEHQSRRSAATEPRSILSLDDSSSDLSVQSCNESRPSCTAPVLRPPCPPLRTTSLVRCSPRTTCGPPLSIPCSTAACSLTERSDFLHTASTCSQSIHPGATPTCTISPLDNADQLADREVELTVSQLDSMWWLRLLPYKPSNLPDCLADRLRQRSSLMLSRSSPNTRLSNSSLPLANLTHPFPTCLAHSPHFIRTMTQSLHERHPSAGDGGAQRTPSDTSSKLCPRPPARPSSLYTENANINPLLLPSLSHLLSATSTDPSRCSGHPRVPSCYTLEYTHTPPCFVDCSNTFSPALDDLSKPRIPTYLRGIEAVPDSIAYKKTDSPLLGQYCRLLILRTTNSVVPSPSTPTGLHSPSAETPVTPV